MSLRLSILSRANSKTFLLVGIASLIAYCVWIVLEIAGSRALEAELGPWEGYYFTTSSTITNLLQLEVSIVRARDAKNKGQDWKKEAAEAERWQNNLISRWYIVKTTDGLLAAVSNDDDARQSIALIDDFMAEAKDGLEALKEGREQDFESWLRRLDKLRPEVSEVGMRARQLETEQRNEYQTRLESAQKRALFSNLAFLIGYAAIMGMAVAWWKSKEAKLRSEEMAMRVSKEAIEAKIDATTATEENERSRRAFINAVAHELRTPMQSLLTSADLIDMAEQESSSDYWDDDVKMASARIRVAVEQMRVQLKDLAAFAKGSAELDRSSVNRDTFVVSKYYDDMVASVSSLAESSQVDVRFAMTGARELTVVGDPRRLMQVANNLIGNAIKYTAAGSVEVTLECNPNVEGDGKTRALLRLTVEDTGSGIAADDLPHITEAFYSGANSKGKQSTGLGLAIVKNLMEKMGGKLQIESQKGVGTKAIAELWVPVKKLLKSPVVLVVDDELVDLFSAVLGKMGCTVDTALSGERAVEMTEIKHYDLVLVDIQLGGISGVETAREIRKQARSESEATPVVAITAFKDIISEEEAPLFAKVLEKPIDGAVLGSMLFEVLHWKKKA